LGDCFRTMSLDLEFGHAGEVLVAAASMRRLLAAVFCEARETPRAGLDFYLLDRRIEVKTDRQMGMEWKGRKATGNFSFEVVVHGKPGLLSYPLEEAPHYLAYVECHELCEGRPVRGIIWWFRYSGLREWVCREHGERQGRGESWRTVGACGDSHVVNILVPSADLLAEASPQWLLGRWKFHVGGTMKDLRVSVSVNQGDVYVPEKWSHRKWERWTATSLCGPTAGIQWTYLRTDGVDVTLPDWSASKWACYASSFDGGELPRPLTIIDTGPNPDSTHDGMGSDHAYSTLDGEAGARNQHNTLEDMYRSGQLRRPKPDALDKME